MAEKEKRLRNAVILYYLILSHLYSIQLTQQKKRQKEIVVKLINSVSRYILWIYILETVQLGASHINNQIIYKSATVAMCEYCAG